LRDIQLAKSGSKNGDDGLGSLISIGAAQKNDYKKNQGYMRPKCVLVLEDNLEFSGKLDTKIFASISNYLESEKGADMIHLSYIVPYVPNLTVSRSDDDNIVGLATGQSLRRKR
jgi:hypothetical protein